MTELISFVTTAWVHPREGGDDFPVTMCLGAGPDTEECAKEAVIAVKEWLEDFGSAEFNDYTIVKQPIVKAKCEECLLRDMCAEDIVRFK